jgi:hypothetical protein
MHPEAADDRLDRRYVLLVLVGDAVLADLPVAAGMRAPLGQRHVVVLVDAPRDRARGSLAVCLPGLAPRALRVGFRLALGEGRGLALARAREFLDFPAHLRYFGLKGAHAGAVVALRAAHSGLDLLGGSATISADAAAGWSREAVTNHDRANNKENDHDRLQERDTIHTAAEPLPT